MILVACGMMLLRHKSSLLPTSSFKKNLTYFLIIPTNIGTEIDTVLTLDRMISSKTYSRQGIWRRILDLYLDMLARSNAMEMAWLNGRSPRPIPHGKDPHDPGAER
jgi:hypothetical protein